MEEEFKNQNILGRDLVDEMEESYLSYAMSVIISRALPDVRDGLKPVHRRVLYGASGIGAQWNRKHKKSARIVGEVGKKADKFILAALLNPAQFAVYSIAQFGVPFISIFYSSISFICFITFLAASSSSYFKLLPFLFSKSWYKTFFLKSFF